MALPLEMTLDEVRQAVFRRCGISTAGGLTAERNSVVDEQVRRAERLIYARFEWLHRLVELDVPMTTGVDSYDIPDDCDPGRIARMCAINVDGKEYEIVPDDRVAVRRGLSDLDAGQPIVCAFTNEVFQLRPAPSADWPTLRFTYTPRPATVVSGTSRMAVDSEAVIQMAVIAVKRLWDVGGLSSREVDECDAYIYGMRDLSKIPEMFNVASDNLGDGRMARNDNAWQTAWNPSGGW